MEEKIGGLEIAVHDAVCVYVVQGRSSLVHVRYGLRESECTALCQFIAQAPSWEVGHDQVCQPILFTVFINGHNVNVFKPGDDIGFASEAGKIFLVYPAAHRYIRQQYLDGDMSGGT